MDHLEETREEIYPVFVDRKEILFAFPDPVEELFRRGDFDSVQLAEGFDPGAGGDLLELVVLAFVFEEGVPDFVGGIPQFPVDGERPAYSGGNRHEIEGFCVLIRTNVRFRQRGDFCVVNDLNGQGKPFFEVFLQRDRVNVDVWKGVDVAIVANPAGDASGDGDDLFAVGAELFDDAGDGFKECL